MRVVFVEKNEEQVEEEGNELGPEEMSRGLTRNISPSRSSMKKQNDMDDAASTMTDENSLWSFGQTI